jgi:CRP-like cAMP-binding protein
MTPQESRRAALRRVKIFTALTDKDCDEVLTCVRGKTLVANETLYEQGSTGDKMAIVMDGNLSVRLDQKEIATVGPGGMLGEMACVDPAPRSASVVATVKTTVLEVNREALSELRELAPAANSAIVGQVIREVTRRLREVNERLEKDLAPGTKLPSSAPAAPPAAAPRPAAAPARSQVVSAMRPEAAEEKGAGEALVSGFKSFLDRFKGNT